MSVTRAPAIILVLALLSAGAAVGVVFSSSNTLPTSSSDYASQAQAVNNIKPAECTAILSGIVTGSGTFSGTAASELILGSAGVDTISGGDGADCILGGGGDDAIDGEDGDDVIFGGPDIDVCTGGLGTDSFPNAECETATQ